MKKVLSLVIVFFALLFSQSVYATEVDYTIDSYVGELVIHEDNGATFTQLVTFSYDSDYNGQYISLGTAGNMPEGFDILGQPLVVVQKNGSAVSASQIDFDYLGDGYRLKIYNGGQSGDLVTVKVVWELANILFPYQDVAELNWKPISDWDQTIDKVSFTIKTDRVTDKSELWAHRGYFKGEPQVSRTDQGMYQVSVDSLSGVLELHAYWDKEILTDQVALLSEKALSRIEKTEKAIARKSKLLQTVFGTMLPATILITVISQVWRFIKVKKDLDKYRPKLGKTRLYEVPEELSPAVLASEIYQVTFKELVEHPKSGKVRFDNLVQAMILDMLDRGILSLDKREPVPYLKLVDLDKTTKSDLAFLNMAFGDRLEVALDKLFSDFKYEENTVKKLGKQYSGTQLEKMVRSQASKIRRKITVNLAAIDQAVAGETEKAKRPVPYRKLTKDEKRKLDWASGMGCFLCLVTGGLSFYFLLNASLLSVAYFLLTILILVVTLILSRLSLTYRKQGAISPEGAYRLEQWQSFERMMDDINKFETIELEGLVVWNRLLVYATLLGYAKKVERYLKVHQIALPEDMERLNLHLMTYLLVSSHHLTTTSHQANTDANFSVSSGGSGGSGGFSGGGGGGGGGSF